MSDERSSINFDDMIEEISDEVFPIHLFHELFHMATTVRKGDILYCGLSQQKEKYGFGLGLNEGVTQMLTEEYFKDFKRYSPYESYPYEKLVARSVCKLIGRDFLEDKYFKNDLGSVVNELAKYSSYEKAKQFVVDMDFLLIYGYNFDKTLINRKAKIREKLDAINEFLINCYKTKLEMENNEDARWELNSFIGEFEDNVMYPHFDYVFTNPLRRNADNIYTARAA